MLFMWRELLFGKNSSTLCPWLNPSGKVLGFHRTLNHGNYCIMELNASNVLFSLQFYCLTKKKHLRVNFPFVIASLHRFWYFLQIVLYLHKERINDHLICHSKVNFFVCLLKLSEQIIYYRPRSEVGLVHDFYIHTFEFLGSTHHFHFIL